MWGKSDTRQCWEHDTDREKALRLRTSDWEMAGLLADDTVLPKLDIDWVPMKEDLAYSEYLED